MYSKIFKPFFDLSASLFGIFLLSPFFILISVVLFFQNNGKVFFLQERPGKNKNPFYIIKFKTMNDKRDQNGNLLPDNTRITRIGRLIRKTSLDEIPQLINVLKGDMSLVGPRPLLFKYIPLYTKDQDRRHEVKPGITGWAQINGRNSISWNKKFELDYYYVENISFFLDLKIICLTVLKVLKSEGVDNSKSRPMVPYNGKN